MRFMKRRKFGVIAATMAIAASMMAFNAESALAVTASEVNFYYPNGNIAETLHADQQGVGVCHSFYANSNQYESWATGWQNSSWNGYYLQLFQNSNNCNSGGLIISIPLGPGHSPNHGVLYPPYLNGTNYKVVHG